MAQPSAQHWRRLYARVLKSVADWMRPEAEIDPAIRRRVQQLDFIVAQIRRGRAHLEPWSVQRSERRMAKPRRRSVA